MVELTSDIANVYTITVLGETGALRTMNMLRPIHENEKVRIKTYTILEKDEFEES